MTASLRPLASKVGLRLRSDPVALAAVLVVLLKAVLLVLDPRPQFFLGDSASYLETAVSEWIPPDRSFTYGYAIRAVAVSTGSLLPLVVLQTAAGALAAVLVAFVLRRCCAASFGATLLGALVFALSPVQLYHERAVLTEALAGCAVASAIALAFWYLRRPRLISLAAVQVAGIAAVSLRTSCVPLTAFLAIAPPLLALRRGVPGGASRGRVVRRIAGHLVCACALFLGLHGAYQRAYGHLSGGPPGYLQNDGFFLLASAGPLLRPQDAPTPELAQVIAAPEEFSRADRLWANQQLWHPSGLIQRWRAVEPDPVRANALAKATARRALAEQPLAMAALLLKTWLQYLSYDIVFMLTVEEGADRPLTANLRERLARTFSLEADAWWGKEPTLVKTLHMELRAWHYVLAFAPLLAFAALVLHRRRLLPECVLLLGVSALLWLASTIMLVAYRFLHPQDLTVALSLGLLADAVHRRWRRSG